MDVNKSHMFVLHFKRGSYVGRNLCKKDFISLDAPGYNIPGQKLRLEAIQTPDRQTVAIGDRLDLMRSHMQASPMKMESYPLQKKGQPTTLAVDYTYEIANMRYVITVVNDHVMNIKTENLDGLKQ